MDRFASYPTRWMPWWLPSGELTCWYNPRRVAIDFSLFSRKYNFTVHPHTHTQYAYTNWITPIIYKYIKLYLWWIGIITSPVALPCHVCFAMTSIDCFYWNLLVRPQRTVAANQWSHQWITWATWALIVPGTEQWPPLEAQGEGTEIRSRWNWDECGMDSDGWVWDVTVVGCGKEIGLVFGFVRVMLGWGKAKLRAERLKTRVAPSQDARVDLDRILEMSRLDFDLSAS